eukprot:TRINITY_DN11898_c0_g1_i4.p1 TRINITY_DN11898_c0_g1~~TRINITY_DN11898_c0_g1_i4.p1  ORF type:complete len:759 (+),score=101.75 TRINITY_DN11898_c0_g1_i4:554-2830(+)
MQLEKVLTKKAINDARRLEEASANREEQERKEKIVQQLLYKLYSEITPWPLESVINPENIDNIEPKKKTRSPRSRIPSLWNLCLTFVCGNLDLYDGFEHVPVEWKAKMFAKLTLTNKLSTERFETLIDPQQRYLDLTVCRTLVTDGFFRALRKSPFLQKLIVRDCETLTNASFQEIVLNCPSLTYLDISGCPVKEFTNLEKLPLQNLYLDNMRLSGLFLNERLDKIRSLQLFNNLKVLSMNQSSMTSLRLYTLLAHFPWLTHLYANESGPHSEPPVEQKRVLVCRQLEVFECKCLQTCSLFNYLFTERENCSQSRAFEGTLRRLSIGPVNKENVEFISKHFKHVLDLDLAQAENCDNFGNIVTTTNLTRLAIDFTISYDILPSLLALEHLKSFTMRNFSDTQTYSLLHFLQLFGTVRWPIEEMNIHGWPRTNYNKFTDPSYLVRQDHINWLTYRSAYHGTLRKLVLTDISWLSFAIFRAIANNYTMPNLEHLNITGSCTDVGVLNHVLTCFPKLQILAFMVQNHLVVNSDLLQFAEHPIYHENLRLLSINFVPNRPFYHEITFPWHGFFNSFPNLQVLILGCCKGWRIPCNIEELIGQILMKRSLKTVGFFGSFEHKHVFFSSFSQSLVLFFPNFGFFFLLPQTLPIFPNVLCLLTLSHTSSCPPPPYPSLFQNNDLGQISHVIQTKSGIKEVIVGPRPLQCRTDQEKPKCIEHFSNFDQSNFYYLIDFDQFFRGKDAEQGRQRGRMFTSLGLRNKTH